MLLDARGRPVADTEDVWMVQALFEWLSDARVRHLVLRRGLMDYTHLRVLGGFLDLELRTRVLEMSSPTAPACTKMSRVLVKRAMLTLLRDRPVRLSIARSMWWDNRGKGAVRKELQQIREELEVEELAQSLTRGAES